MKDQEIQLILQNALEEKIPSEQVQLWPAVKASLVARKPLVDQQGENMNSPKSYRTLRPALAVLLIVVLLAIGFATPQGRSFAQSILQFFTRADSTTFPLKPSQIAPGEPDPSAPTAMPPAPLLTVAEAEAQAGFKAAELPFVPDGFNYLGARLYGNMIALEYQTQDSGGHLIIKQSREGFAQSDWDEVPADAIFPIKIGELDGEYVQGTFVVYPGETSAAWNPEAPLLRLRWVADNIWFEMTKFGNVEAIEYLDQASLIKLAESLATNP